MADLSTLQDLQARYADPEDRRKIFNLINLTMILHDSIIKRDYQVPQAIPGQVQLTDYGMRIFDALRKRQVPYSEARLLCLLEVYYNELLVDINATDLDAVTQTFSRQVADRSLNFPFTSGRLLYDRFFGRHVDDFEHILDSEETQELLQDTPQGVFQYGRLVTGPFGIGRSRSSRQVNADRDVPLRHCPDPSCAVVHRVHLSSSSDATINKHRDSLTKILQREEGHGATWGRFIDDVTSAHISSYVDWAFEPIVVLLGDALDDTELRKLLTWLLKTAEPDQAPDIRQFRALSQEKPPVSTLNRAQLLQLILLAGNDALLMGLDTLVRSNEINVPPSEIRRPVINRAVRFGRHGLRAELGPYGVRVDSTFSSIAPLRAKELVEQMYRLEDEKDRRELDWQMRGEPSDSLEAKLEHYLLTRPPEEALGRLIVHRVDNVTVATTRYGLGDIARHGDDALMKAILWKLGFNIRTRGKVHDEFWRAHETMLNHARKGVVGADPEDKQNIGEAVATYITALERLLADSLAYVTWALGTDHHLSSKPYVYRPHIDGPAAFATLDEFTDEESDTKRLGTGSPPLQALIGGFAKLAALLNERESHQEDFLRPPEELPTWMESQSLERFPFVHKIAFLDLLPDCKVSITRILRDITNRLKSADLPATRSAWLYGNRSGSAASLDRLGEGLDDVRVAVFTIEESGFSRQLYSRISDTIDGDERRTIVLSNSVGRRIELYGPSPFSWLRMPGWHEAQYVMNTARFAEPVECLRFTSEVDSPYSRMWNDYPRRPTLQRRRAGAPLAQSMTDGSLP